MFILAEGSKWFEPFAIDSSRNHRLNEDILAFYSGEILYLLDHHKFLEAFLQSK
jgi:hypothetical protein